MRKTHLAVTALRILLVMAFALLVVFQTMSVPGQFADIGKEEPGLAYLRWPLTAFFVLELVCVQVVIVSTWKLLTLVKHDRIFTEGSLKWVDAIVGAIVTGWVLLLGLLLYFFLSLGRPDDPSVPMLLSLPLVGGAVLGLLMVVMRALLRQATMLRTDMEAVI